MNDKERTASTLRANDVGRRVTIAGFDVPSMATGELLGVERIGENRRLVTLADSIGRWSIGCPSFQRIYVTGGGS